MTYPSSQTPWTDSNPVPFPSQTDDSSWETLERFIQALHSGSLGPTPYDHLLGAIREATDAQVAFLCNDQTGEVLGSSGDFAHSPHWYHQITRILADELPRGGSWKASGVSGTETLVLPRPSSAILVPIRNLRCCWLVGLQFCEDREFSSNDLRVARVIWQLHNDHHRHERIHDNLKETLFGVVRCLTTAIDAKDPYTCGHSERVARIAVRLGEEMGLNRGETSDLYLAGLLHDLGKIGIRDAVLCKEGPLTPDEYFHMQEHPVIGERIIANVTRLAYLRPGIRGHHERFDGQGYPDRLEGEAIPLMARILAVADACDAMMSVRRYRAALSQAKIIEIFREGAGTQWDPRIVQNFLECRHELFAVIERGLGQSVYFAVERAVGGADTIQPGGPTHFRKPAAPLRNR